MKTIAYTDSSIAGKRSVAVCIVLNSYTYLCSGVKEYTVTKPTHGELCAIILAATKLKELGVTKEAIIKSDNESLVNIGNRILSMDDVPDSVMFREEWFKFLDITRGMGVTLQHIRAHNVQYNPNSACDKLAHALVRTLGGW